MTYENAEALPGGAALPEAVAAAVAPAPALAFGCVPLARRTAPEEGVA
ncbi:hypothetical protein [Streptomyces sp. Ac-502]